MRRAASGSAAEQPYTSTAAAREGARRIGVPSISLPDGPRLVPSMLSPLLARHPLPGSLGVGVHLRHDHGTRVIASSVLTSGWLGREREDQGRGHKGDSIAEVHHGYPGPIETTEVRATVLRYRHCSPAVAGLFRGNATPLTTLLQIFITQLTDLEPVLQWQYPSCRSSLSSRKVLLPPLVGSRKRGIRLPATDRIGAAAPELRLSGRTSSSDHLVRGGEFLQTSPGRETTHPGSRKGQGWISHGRVHASAP